MACHASVVVSESAFLICHTYDTLEVASATCKQGKSATKTFFADTAVGLAQILYLYPGPYRLLLA